MDVEVYNTRNMPEYVIQFEDNDGRWVDTFPAFRSQESAVAHLNNQRSTSYAYRVVRRTK